MNPGIYNIKVQARCSLNPEILSEESAPLTVEVATGGSWVRMDSGITQNVNDLWGSSGADIFAVADDAQICHFDGSTWNTMYPGFQDDDLLSVWGTSPNDVFVAGRNGRIVHYDGDQWYSHSIPLEFIHADLQEIWGSSSTDVYVVSDWNTGLLLHYNGAFWEEIDCGTTEKLMSIWGSSSSDIYVTGANGTIIHYDGTTWGEMDSGTETSICKVCGLSEDTIYALGAQNTILYSDGYTWSEVSNLTTSQVLFDICCTSDYQLYAVGGNGAALHSDDMKWQQMVTGFIGEITTIWSCPNRGLFAAGNDGGIIYYPFSIYENGWENCYIEANDIFDIWGTSDSNIFTTGREGEIRHYNGFNWDSMESCDVDWFEGIWGSYGTDVFAVGNRWDEQSSLNHGVIIHYDGTSWTEIERTYYGLHDVWGVPGDTVFAVGDLGSIYQHGDENWIAMPTGSNSNLYGVWGSSESNIFAVGESGEILHYDGDIWNAMNSGTNQDLTSVWGCSDDDVFVVGVHGTILHYNGASWSTMDTRIINDLNGIWGDSNTDVFAVGDSNVVLHYDGTVWRFMNTSSMGYANYTNLYGVWGSCSTDIYTVGRRGTILHYGGGYPPPGYITSAFVEWDEQSNEMVYSWSATDFDTDNFEYWLCPYLSLDENNDVDNTYPDRIANEMEYDYANTVLNLFPVSDNSGRLDLIGGKPEYISGKLALLGYDSSSNSAWVLDRFKIDISRWDISTVPDKSWRPITSYTSNRLKDIWSAPKMDAYAVGVSGTILHFTGQNWFPMSSGTEENLNGIWGSSDSDIFAVGNNGLIIHYDGTAWIPMISNTNQSLYEIWGNGATDIFAVGDEGTILHYNGASWISMDSGTTKILLSVWGSSATDIFAVGYDGIILHYDGNSWTSTITHNTLVDIWGSSGSDVIAVGWNGKIMHYNGTAWSTMVSNTSQQLYGVWGSSDSDIYVVGQGGIILHYDGCSWNNLSSNTNIDLYAVQGHSEDEIFAAGKSGSMMLYTTAEPPVPGTISGVVYEDSNANGIIDNGEIGIDGITVTLFSDLTVIDTTVTNADGSYTFTELTQGIYTVTETELEIYRKSTPNDVKVTLIDNSGAVVNFGNTVIITGTLSGTVYEDVNKNGDRDAEECGIEGVDIQVKQGDVVIDTAITAEDGSYTFSRVEVGLYTVEETDPPGYDSTTPNLVGKEVIADETVITDFGDCLKAQLPPVLTGISSQSVEAGQCSIVVLSATDPNIEQTLTFIKMSGPDWAIVEGSGTSPGPVSGNLTLNPGKNDEGTYQVVIRVSDGGTAEVSGLYDEVTVVIVVTEDNHPPVLDPISRTIVHEQETNVVELSATDLNSAQTITFCKISGPEWATVSGTGISPGAVSGALTLAPGLQEEGEYSVFIRVIDGGTAESPVAFDDMEVKIIVVSNGHAALIIESTTGGVVSNPGEGVFFYDQGDEVSVISYPNFRFGFTGWSGDILELSNKNQDYTFITMNQDCSITANFLPVAMPGDANQDGQVNALDITSVERIIVGLD